MKKSEVPDPYSVKESLERIAKSQGSDQAQVAIALLAWAHTNDLDRIDQKKRDRLITIQNTLVFLGIIVLIIAAWEGFKQRESTEKLTQQVYECTGEDPTTQCREAQAKNTTPVVQNLQKSIDCTALWTQGIRPEPCQEVDARMDAFSKGEDPFNQPAKGNP